MLGVVVNALSVIVCSLIGLCCKKIINERIENTVMQALGVCVLLIGIIDAINPVSGTSGILVLLISFAVGGAIGSAINIQKGLDNLGVIFEKKLLGKFTKKASESSNITQKNPTNHNFAEGFVQATMVFCVGAMTIYGSISAGLGDNKTLLIKSVLDGVVALLLTVKYGIGVSFAALPILVIQGAFALLAGSVGEFLNSSITFRQELSAIGGVIVMMIGLNLLEVKKIPVANMLPALLGACYYLIF